jgi:hypothetical protein
MVSEMNGVNIQKLRELYRQNEIVREVLDFLGTYERFFRATTVEHLRRSLRQQGVLCTDKAVRDALLELQEVGCGWLYLGRRGHKTRFKWDFSYISIAEVASGEQEQVEVREPDEDSEEEVSPLVSHMYQLRPDLVVNLELPLDFSSGEAVRLAKFIESLPFS